MSLRTHLALSLASALLLAGALPAAAQSAAPAAQPAPEAQAPGPGQTKAKPARHHLDRATRIANFVKRVDADHDGTISLAEAQAYAGKRFDRIDKTHKGYLTVDDFEGRVKAAIARTDDAKKKARLEHRLPRIEAAFKKLDGNGDGKITREEYVAAASARFAAADANHDGKLTAQEIEAVHGRAF